MKDLFIVYIVGFFISLAFLGIITVRSLSKSEDKETPHYAAVTIVSLSISCVWPFSVLFVAVMFMLTVYDKYLEKKRKRSSNDETNI